MGKLVVYLVSSRQIATRIGWHMWEIDLRFATGLLPEWAIDDDSIEQAQACSPSQ